MADESAAASDEGTGDKKVEAEGTILGKESSGGDAGSGDTGQGGEDDKLAAKTGASDADDKTDQKKDDDKGDDQQDEGEKPGEFDTSKFEIPEGTEISKEWMSKLTEHPVIQKLVQSDVNQLIGVVGEFVNDRENARIETQNTRTAEWVEAFGKDPWVIERGIEKVGPLAVATRDAFFPGMTQLFDETGLGSNRIMLIGLAKIAEDLHILESQLEGGGTPPGAGAKGSAAHRIFKDYVPGGKHDPDGQS